MAPALLYDSSSITQSPKSCKGVVTSRLSQKPNIAELEFSTYRMKHELVDDIVESLKISGGCIIRGMYRQGTLDAMEEEIRPYIAATHRADTNREDFVPSSTKMVTGLLGKSRTYALSVAGNEVWHDVSKYFLTSTLTNSWHGDQSRTSVSLPQLSTTVTFSVGPGTQAQGLHRDDDIYHTQHPASDKHHLGRDTMVCLFVAGKRCTKDNGATRILPGSHLWDYTTPPPSYEKSPELFSHAEMAPGDVFIMLGGAYHGAGSNITEYEERLVYAAFATRGYLRQEENQYLSNDLERIRELPLELQRFAGFGASKPYMGWVDMQEPISILNPGVVARDVDFW